MIRKTGTLFFRFRCLRARSLLLLAGCCALLLAGAPVAAAADEPFRPRADRVIVKLRDRPAEQKLAPIDPVLLGQLSAHLGRPLALVRVMGDGSQLLRLDARMPVADAEALARQLATHPGVESVSVDRIALPQ